MRKFPQNFSLRTVGKSVMIILSPLCGKTKLRIFQIYNSGFSGAIMRYYNFLSSFLFLFLRENTIYFQYNNFRIASYLLFKYPPPPSPKIHHPLSWTTWSSGLSLPIDMFHVNTMVFYMPIYFCHFLWIKKNFFQNTI